MVKDALNCLLDADMNVSKHFKLKEFFQSPTAEKHGIDNCPPTYVKLTCVLQNLQSLCAVLELVRSCNNKPIIVTSGYRSVALNKKVGGVIGSYHQHGAAVDITQHDFDYLLGTMEFLELKNVTWYADMDKKFIHIQLKKYVTPPPTRLPNARYNSNIN